MSSRLDSRSPSPAFNNTASTARPELNTSSSPTSPTTDLLSSPSAIYSAIAYPVSYTFSGLLRRISIDEAPTPLAKALSANYNGSMADTLPPPPLPTRTRSPYQPPALTPLTLTGYKDTTRKRERLLNRSLAEEIRLLVPARLQLVDQWRLIYSLEQDGASLNRLYALCERFRGKRAGFVLVVRDGSGEVLGAYLSDPPHPSPSYYGTGECFLWRTIPMPTIPDLIDLPPLPSEDTTHATRVTTISAPVLSHQNSSASLSRANGTMTPPQTVRKGSEDISPRVRFKAFPFAGENDYSILCSSEFLSLGGGNGKYGLWLDDRLARGISGGVPTFLNENLSDGGERFDVLGVEIWYVGS